MGGIVSRQLGKEVFGHVSDNVFPGVSRACTGVFGLDAHDRVQNLFSHVGLVPSITMTTSDLFISVNIILCIG